MQLIAEVYQILKHAAQLSNTEIAKVLMAEYRNHSSNVAHYA